MKTSEDIQLHELEHIERNLCTETLEDASTEGGAGPDSASGFMINSASGFMIN